MSGGIYQGKVLDHAMNPRNRGVLEPADFSHEDAGSVCGDEVRIDIRLTGDRVAAVAFSGRGCAVSQASASILTELLANMALADVEALSEDDLLAAIGVPLGPARLECALLSLAVLRASMSPAGATTRPGVAS
jgi:nitrogen fixation protein NifU and related proteins